MGTLSVAGRILDLFGFPMQGKSILIVSGYQLDPSREEWQCDVSVAGPANSDARGAFSLSATTASSHLAIHVKSGNRAVPINVRDATRTSIPVFHAELWSPDTARKLDELRARGVLTNLLT